jgi:hypothetical protein
MCKLFDIFLITYMYNNVNDEIMVLLLRKMTFSHNKNFLMRKKIVAGNWKMNKVLDEAVALDF